MNIANNKGAGSAALVAQQKKRGSARQTSEYIESRMLDQKGAGIMTTKGSIHEPSHRVPPCPPLDPASYEDFLNFFDAGVPVIHDVFPQGKMPMPAIFED